MFEKVNPMHPDKVADRIAGAIVDKAYELEKNPKIAVEVLIGHEICTIITETSVSIPSNEIALIVARILKVKDTKDMPLVEYYEHEQDAHLSKNQEKEIRCGDNGIFKGVPITSEQKKLSLIARNIFARYPTDGKYIIDKDKLVICQSNAKTNDLKADFSNATINPLGDWTGGITVDTGATNRKLGSDMGDSVTGGGLHGKDLSKADVSVNIYAWLKAQETGKPVEISCAIGDTVVDGKPYSEIVKIARDYIDLIGGFEKFACWGLL